jgi:hypothetical protein
MLTSACWAAAVGGSRRRRLLPLSGRVGSAAAGTARPAKRGSREDQNVGHATTERS